LNKSKRRSSINFYIIVFLIVYLFCEAGMYYIHVRNADRIKKAYNIQCENAVKGMKELFTPLFNVAVSSSNMLFSETWYNHLRNHIGYYDEEFNANKKNDIINEIQNLVTSHAYVFDIVMIIPASDIVICRKNWLTLAQYEKMYNDVRITVTNPETGEFTIDSDNPYILLNDPLPRKERCGIAVIVDTKSLGKAVSLLADENTAWVNVTIEGRTAVEIGEKGGIIHTASNTYPNIVTSMGFKEVDLTNSRTTFMLLSVALFLLLVVMAMYLSNRMLKPVRSLVLESGGSKQDFHEPFAYVRAYISGLKNFQNELMNVNTEKENELEKLKNRAREDILYGLLSARKIEFEDPAVNMLFPWIAEKNDMCLFAMDSKGVESRTILEADLLNAVAHSVQTENNEGTFALIWLTDGMSQDEKDEYREHLRREWGRKNNKLVFVSPLIKSFAGVREAAGILRKDLKEGVQIHSALSQEARAMLSELVQTASAEELQKTIRNLMSNYEPMDVMNAIRVSVDLPPEDTLESWQDVLLQAARIAEAQKKEIPVEPSEAKKYVDYIDEHFSDSELSVNSISDYFEKHRTIISKEIKMLTGYSFTDYLKNKRICEALKRIESGNENIMKIATEVGYVSYSTFKRAFIQIVGKTPMELRDETLNRKEK